MKVVVDENIPYAREAFASVGEVCPVPGRSIGPNQVEDAEVLVVRSVTRVDRALLEGSAVRFVGTCTIGTDHLDIPWLESQGIRWASAPGCNARSVAEWVFSTLAWGHFQRRLDLSGLRQVGIVGAGRVGNAMGALLESLGWEVLKNDPPREAREGSSGFHPLEDVLALPLVLAHLPLVNDGPWPTRGLLAENLGHLPFGAGLVNAGRGATFSTPALVALASRRPDVYLALDVFDPEPALPVDLALKADLISPHVAGYSLEGKIEGTRMVREALGQALDLPPWIPSEPDSVPLEAKALPSTPSGHAVDPHSDPWDALSCLVLAAHSPARDDAVLRECLTFPDKERGTHFDRMRKEYPTRLEWRHRPVRHPEVLPRRTWDLACRLGFREA
ncbi:MAG TPA: 4-phosphoerythronate dehydrogenase [Fibrobacteria bacterium]|nr:4-phosphoerythronate dehydrogenase [Fibrobacteria bacterium]